jgi:segregation and condensation protein B
MDDDLVVFDRVESAASDCSGFSVLSEAENPTCGIDCGPDGLSADTPAAEAAPAIDDESAALAAEQCRPEAAELQESGVSRTRQSDAPPNDQIIEALLFSADTPLSLNRLSELAGCTPLQARLAVADLNARYMVAKLSFRIEEIARGYQMMTLPRFQPWLAKLTAQRVQTRLSPAALETLSIVAYKQPIIRADIEAIRGVAAGEVLNRLREMGLVRIVGRAEVVGRPLLYSTTKKFLDVFGLADLDDLPPLEALNLRRRSVKADESDSAAGESATAEPSAEQDSEPLPESEPRLAASA